MKHQSENDHDIPEYIEEQANNSWQMELFISLGMIFTLTKIPAIVSKEFYESNINVNLDSLIILGFFGVVALSRIFLIGFAANLIFRAIWLGLLGIYYVYPQGINEDKLDFSDTFTKNYKPKLKTLDKVKKFERYSSLSFSMGIISGIQCLGILFIMALIYFFALRVFNFEAIDNAHSAYIILFILVLFSNGFLDKIVFGKLKNVKWLNKLYLPVHKAFNFISGHWFIQYERMTLISNSGRWKVGLVSALYTLAAVVISANDLGMSNTMGFKTIRGLDSREFTNVPATELHLQNDEYDDLLSEDDLINVVSIPSEHISGDILTVFVTYDKYFDYTFERRAKIKKLEKKIHKGFTRKLYAENRDKMRAIINESLYVKLDSITYDSLDWYIRSHPVTNQKGFQATIDISDYPLGSHDIIVRPIRLRDNNRVDTISGRWIPFIKIK